jgi:predicted DNA-binding protein (UPF0251 family)
MPLSLQELHSRAVDAAEGWTQNDLADAIGVDQSAVSRALSTATLKHASVQARIISRSEGTPVQRRSTYEGNKVRHEWVIDP